MWPALTGVHLQDIVDMRVYVYDESGSLKALYTKDTDPETNPITDVELEVDALAGLIKGKINLAKRWFDPPFSLEIMVSLVDKIYGEVAIGRGYQEIIGFTADTIESSIDLQPIEKIVIDDIYQGSLPIVVENVTTGSYNMVPYITAEANKVPEDEDRKSQTRTNQEVLSELTSKYPTLTYGVDGYGRSIIGVPESGVPIIIDTLETYGLVPNNHVINDYYTHLTATGEAGWMSYSASREVGRLTPKRYKEVGAPKTEEVTTEFGGPMFVAATSFVLNVKIPYVNQGGAS